MPMPFSRYPGTLEEWLGSGAGGSPTAGRPVAQQAEPTPEPTLEQRPRRRQRKRRRRLKREDVARMFFNKLQYGTAAPGPGMIPYSVLPEQFRRGVELDQPPVGWDPRQLSDRERRLALNLVQRADVADERRNIMLRNLMQAQQEADIKRRRKL